MASAPKVETLAQSMAMLASGYNEQRGLVNEQIEGLSGLYSAKTAALDAAKAKGFSDINNQATGRGMSFSGIPADEQATYLSTNYLPALAGLATAEANERTELRSQIAQLNTQQNAAAVSRIDQQQGALNNWNLQMENNRFSAEQNKLNRAHDERLKQMQISADQSIAAANRAASAQQNTTTPNDVISAWAQTMFTSLGGSDAYKKNYAWENSGIQAQLQAMGVSNKESYALRKQLLGY